jgi:hypothetical protein
MKIHSWKIYEDAARQVLVDIRQLLGLSSVEGKQTFNGKSGTTNLQRQAEANWLHRADELCLNGGMR